MALNINRIKVYVLILFIAGFRNRWRYSCREGLRWRRQIGHRCLPRRSLVCFAKFHRYTQRWTIRVRWRHRGSRCVLTIAAGINCLT